MSLLLAQQTTRRGETRAGPVLLRFRQWSVGAPDCHRWGAGRTMNTRAPIFHEIRREELNVLRLKGKPRSARAAHLRIRESGAIAI